MFRVAVLCSHINENMTVFVVRLAFAYKMFRICPFFYVFALWRLNDFFIKKCNYNHVFDSSLISTFNSDEEGSYSDFYPIIPANLMSVKEILNMDACHRTWWVFWACKMLYAIYWTANLEKGGRQGNICIYIFAYFRPFTAHFSLQTISYLYLFEGSNWQRLQWDFFL